MKIRIETNWDDWTEAYIDGKLIYSGHSQPDDLTMAIAHYSDERQAAELIVKDF